MKVQVGKVQLMNSSEFRKKYLENLHSKELPMRKVYADFQAMINEEYKDITRFPVCSRTEKTFYIDSV